MNKKVIFLSHSLSKFTSLQLLGLWLRAQAGLYQRTIELMLPVHDKARSISWAKVAFRLLGTRIVVIPLNCGSWLLLFYNRGKYLRLQTYKHDGLSHKSLWE